MSWFKHHEAPLPATPAEDPAVAIARATWDAWQFAKLDAFTDDLQGVMLRKGEVAHLDVEPVGFVEPRRQPGHWTGRSQGVSIPIVKGIRYRVGASKGTFQQGAEVLTPIDQGRFVVTSTRCLFMGSTRSTEWSYAKLLGYELAGDNRIVFSVSNRQKPSGIVYGDDVELRIEAIVAGALARWSGPDAEHDLLVEMERRYREATAALPRTTVAPGSELPPPVPPTTAS